MMSSFVQPYQRQMTSQGLEPSKDDLEDAAEEVIIRLLNKQLNINQVFS
jgi:hypothetical protein